LPGDYHSYDCPKCDHIALSHLTLNEPVLAEQLLHDGVARRHHCIAERADTATEVMGDMVLTMVSAF
jgi:hypothetical protein